MGTLLIRLAAPLQSWGTESKFDIRRTMREPTKSGVVGLLAAALGRRRDEDLSDLRDLRFGVRVDREGELLRDFHMAKKNDKVSYLTYRYYLSDAVFLAGVESPDEKFLQEIHVALTHPAYPLFLGRRSCPPTLPLTLGIRQVNLEDALRGEPCQAAEQSRSKFGKSFRLVLDAGYGETAVTERDLPLSFDPGHRQYGYRAVTEKRFMEKTEDNLTQHDPMKELG